MNEIMILKIDPALPCSTLTGRDEICGQPATVAHVGPLAEDEQTGPFRVKGAYILQPICKECVIKNGGE